MEILSNSPRSSRRFTIGTLRVMRPTNAGNVMKNTSRRPCDSVSRNSGISLLAACADMVGNTAVAMATPNTPRGK